MDDVALIFGSICFARKMVSGPLYFLSQQKALRVESTPPVMSNAAREYSGSLPPRHINIVDLECNLMEQNPNVLLQNVKGVG